MNKTMCLPRLAIIARSPKARPQTFVRRHIEYLNGGNNVVICNKDYEDDVLGKPTIKYSRATLEEYQRSWTGVTAFPFRKKRIKQFLDQHNVGCILVEFGYVATDLGPQITELGRPVYCMFRGNDGSSRLRNPAYRRLLDQVFPKLDGIISVSNHLLENLAGYGFSHPNAIVVPSGADTELFVPGKREKGLCVSVGRLVAKKSPEVMIRAFARQCEKFDLHLEIIGSGNHREMAENLAQTLGVGERVVFRGHLPHSEVVERMKAASFYFQHFQTPKNGDTEGMPNVIQEAMSCGIPIVTTRHAGIPDHLEDGVNGLVVEPNDVDGFSNAIAKVASSKELQTKFGRNARDYAVNNLDYRISHQKIERFLGLGKTQL